MARRRRAARAYQVRAYRSAATTRRILNVLPRRSTPELKCVDTTNGNGSGVVLSLNTTPLVTPLNLVQSGAGFYNRVGRRIEMKSLHLTGLIHSTGKQADQDYCRLLRFMTAKQMVLCLQLVTFSKTMINLDLHLLVYSVVSTLITVNDL